MQQQGEITYAVRYLMRRDCQRGNQPQRHAGQERSSNQNSIESVVNAVADENEYPRRALTTMMVSMPAVIVSVVMSVSSLSVCTSEAAAARAAVTGAAATGGGV